MEKITRGIIESYLACHYKAFLRLTGHEAAAPADDPIPDQSSRLPPAIATGLQSRQGPNQAVKPLRLERSMLRKGESTIIDSVYETDSISLRIPGLSRAMGSSNLGNFHYQPCIVRSGTLERWAPNLGPGV
jgi:hypothetical protein